MLRHSLAPSTTSKKKSFDGSMVKGSSNYARANNYPSLIGGKKVKLLKCIHSFQIRGKPVLLSIVSESLFHDIRYFIVSPRNYLSDHSQISLWIRSDNYSLKPQSDNHDDSLIDVPNNLSIKNHSKIDFQYALCSSSIQTKITKFNETISPSDQAGVNQNNQKFYQKFS